MMTRHSEPTEEQFQPLAEAPELVDKVIDDFLGEAARLWGESMAEMARPVRDFAHSGEASGWVLSEKGKPLGLILTSRRNENGRIQFLHALANDRGPALVAGLLRKAVGDFRQEGARYIACENPFIRYHDTIEQTFGELGFQAIRRMIMVAQLGEKPVEPLPPTGYALVPWDDGYLDNVARIVHTANAGTLDALLYPAMQTVEGVQRMVRSILEGSSGEFDRPASKVALVDGAPCGAILFTRMAPTEGFIAEIAVSPAHQGKGLGGAIFSGAVAVAWEQGIRALNLAVTEDNGPALTLYRRLGFVPKEKMTAYIWRTNGVNQEEANG